MDESLEERLARLEEQTSRPKRTKLYLAIAALVLLLIAGSYGVIQYRGHSVNRAFSAFNLQFTPYYPRSQVGKYKFQPKSLRNELGIVTYSLEDQRRTITVTQQLAPLNPPTLDQIDGFKKLELVNGNGVIGTERGRTLAIINTSTTLISLTGTSDVPKADVADVAATLRPIH